MDKNSLLIARFVGGVSLAFGIASGMLGIWAADQQFALGHVMQVSAAAAVVGFLAIAAFCCLVGYRLLFNRPNRYGQLLSRTGWRFVATSFCMITLTIAAITLGQGNPGAWIGAAALAVLSLASVVAAWVVHRKSAFSPLFPQGTALLQMKEFVPTGFSSGIEIMNDNATPMVFVVSVLQSCVGLSETDAARRMLEIHLNGGALLPTASFEEAARIVEAISEEARAGNHPLACRAVKIE